MINYYFGIFDEIIFMIICWKLIFDVQYLSNLLVVAAITIIRLATIARVHLFYFTHEMSTFHWRRNLRQLDLVILHFFRNAYNKFALLEVSKTVINLNIGMMDKILSLIFALNKSVALLLAKPLDLVEFLHVDCLLLYTTMESIV